ncbi:MAG: cytochrome P450 [Chloroflexota bacterium]|nr:MAG: cytochrome P450 [Chloroflexota bacterium]
MPPEKTAQSSQTIPGPKPSPILGNILDMRQGEVFEILLEFHKKYGDIVLLELPKNQYVYSIASPDSIQHVLQMNNQNYTKGERIRIASPLVGNGLFSSEGEFWRRQRRMMQPAFHKTKIAVLAEEMVRTIEEMLDEWEKLAGIGKPMNIQTEMMALTMEVVTRTLFTSSLTPEEVAELGEQITFLLDVITERSQAIFPIGEKLPSARNRRFDKGVATIDKIIYRLIEDRRKSADKGDDLLGMLLEARDEDTGEMMDDKQLRDELVTMFLAGHETTAIALSWSLALLSQHPTVRRRLQAEVDTILGNRLPSAEDFNDLQFTLAVVSEAMRLYPPLPLTLRQAKEDDILEGYPIKANSGIFINIYSAHHNPDVWENPEGFDPERFLPDRIKDVPRFAYVPFGGGPRQCIGNNFALMESVLALSMINQRYELDLIPGTDLEPYMPGTLRPKGGVPVIIRKR